MRHRLFHTLVISSSFLLDACATTHATEGPDGGASPDAAPGSDAATPPPDAFAMPDALAEADAFVAPDAFASPDAFETPDAFVPPTDDAGVFVDPRACEPGWPTTKGVFHVERDGILYGCRHAEGSNPDMPDLERCCVLGPAE